MIRKLYKGLKGLQLVSNFIKCYLIINISKKNNKSILLLAQNTNIGGTKTFFLNLVQVLSKNEFNVTILLNKNERDIGNESFIASLGYSITYFDRELRQLEYRFSWKHVLKYYFLKDVIQQSIFIIRVANKVSAKKIIISSAYPTSFFPTLITPFKISYFVHSMPWGKIDPGNKLLLHISLRKANKFITVSEYAKNVISKAWKISNKDQKKILVLPSFIDRPSETEYKKNIKVLRVLTLGNLVAVKNPVFWIKVALNIQAKYHDKVEFIWAGQGPLLEKCREIISENRNIKFIGHIEDTANLFQSSDIYFQPSLRESQGLAVVEAMSYGLPCIVTKTGGTVETVIDNFTGLHIDPNNQDDAIERLTLLIEQPELRSELGKNGKARFYEAYTEEKWTKDFLEIV
jgi:glycosyltransferase involved in cell wall biosynthesis